MHPFPLRLLRTFLFIPFLAALFPTSAVGQGLSVEDGTTIRVQNGATWNLEGSTADFGSAGSTAQLVEQSGGHIGGGQLKAVRTLNSPSSADPAGLGLQITASANLGDVTVTRGHAVQTALNGNESIRRFYDVNPSQNNSGLDAELTFTYSDAELNNRSESELEFFKSEDGGSSWSEEGYDDRDAQANTVILGGIESFSRWTLGSESLPLPVELASFEGTSTEEGARLSWETASERNNAGFKVQRRAANNQQEGSWTEIGFVESQVSGGTTSDPTSYQFTDENLPYEPDVLAYRLKQVDTDGSIAYSQQVTVERQTEEVQLLGVFPNPAHQQATLRYAVPERQKVTIQVYDVLGRQVRTVVNGEQSGRQEVQLNVSGLANGVYFLRLKAENATKTRRLTVVR